MAEVFEALYTVDVNAYTEKKNGLTYLSWADAWAEVKKRYPKASYTIKRDEATNLPYVFDPNTGYMVFTSVTIDETTHEMWLPVMDGANKAMKAEPYTYKVKDYKTKQLVEKTVEAATMFDINKTIMRCLVKNLGMFGLGLYVYKGEDLPETEEDVKRAKMTNKERMQNFVDERTGEDKKGVLEYIKKQFGTDQVDKITDEQAKKFIETMKKKGKEI